MNSVREMRGLLSEQIKARGQLARYHVKFLNLVVFVVEDEVLTIM